MNKYPRLSTSLQQLPFFFVPALSSTLSLSHFFARARVLVDTHRHAYTRTYTRAHINTCTHECVRTHARTHAQVQDGEDACESRRLVFRGHFPQKSPILVALVRKETCNSRHTMHLHHPVMKTRNKTVLFHVEHTNTHTQAHTRTYTHTHTHTRTHTNPHTLSHTHTYTHTHTHTHTHTYTHTHTRTHPRAWARVSTYVSSIFCLVCPQVTFPPPRSHTVLGDDCPIYFASDALCHLAGQRHDRDGKHCK